MADSYKTRLRCYGEVIRRDVLLWLLLLLLLCGIDEAQHFNRCLRRKHWHIVC